MRDALPRLLLGIGLTAIVFVLGFAAGRLTAKPSAPATPPAQARVGAVEPQEPDLPPATRDPATELALRVLREAGQIFDRPTGSEQTSGLVAWGDAAAEAPSYALLKRSPESHFGRRVVLRGTVVEIQDQPSGGSMLRLALGGRFSDDILWVETARRPSDKVVDRARVRAYGYLAGEHTYQSQAGWTISLPALYAVGVLEERELARHLRRPIP